jgi:methionyl-tRNA formyltransferase
MEAGMDTGPVLVQEAVAIDPEETAGELANRLAPMGADVLIRTLERLDHLRPEPQDHAAATLAPRLKKEDGWLRLSGSAQDLANRIRGCNPWPGAALMVAGKRLLVWRARAGPQRSAAPHGTLLEAGPGPPGIATGDGLLVPLLVQPENRKTMAWEEFLRGARLGPGARLGEIS